MFKVIPESTFIHGFIPRLAQFFIKLEWLERNKNYSYCLHPIRGLRSRHRSISLIYWRAWEIIKKGTGPIIQVLSVVKTVKYSAMETASLSIWAKLLVYLVLINKNAWRQGYPRKKYIKVHEQLIVFVVCKRLQLRNLAAQYLHPPWWNILIEVPLSRSCSYSRSSLFSGFWYYMEN